MAAAEITMSSTHVKDLTHGNITRELIELAIPLVIGNILQEFYNTIDAFVVGRYAGETQFAAIGVAGTVMNLFLYILIGACAGFSILFARAYGTGDMRELRREFSAALVVGLGITLVLVVGGVLGNAPVLRLLQTPEALTDYVLSYLHWILLALPAAFLYNLFNAILRASGDTNAALYILAGSIVANLALALLFVARLSLGVEGAAMATAITQLLAAVTCGIYLYGMHPELHLGRQDLRVDHLHLTRMLQFGLVAACQQCSLYLGKMLVQGTVNACGTEAIAAYTVGGRVEGFFNSFSTSGGTAESILVAQNVGVGDRERVRQTYRRSCRVQLIGGIASCVLIILLAPIATQFLLGTTTGISYTEAIRYLRWIAPFYIICYIGSLHTGYFSGLGRLEVATIGTTSQIAIRFVICLLITARTGLVGVAVATGIGWAIAVVYWRVTKVRL